MPVSCSFRSSATELCCSVAELLCFGVARSSCVKLIDSQLNEIVSTVSGTIRPTPPQWLPFLSHTAFPGIRRTDVTAKFVHNIQREPYLPLYSDTYSTVQCLDYSLVDQYGSQTVWREAWEADPPMNSATVADPTAVVHGFDLPRREWSLLNHFRSGTGRCGTSLHK